MNSENIRNLEANLRKLKEKLSEADRKAINEEIKATLKDIVKNTRFDTEDLEKAFGLLADFSSPEVDKLLGYLNYFLMAKIFE